MDDLFDMGMARGEGWAVSSLSEDESHASSHSASRGMEKEEVERPRWEVGREEEGWGKTEGLSAIAGAAEWGLVGGGTGTIAGGHGGVG